MAKHKHAIILFGWWITYFVSSSSMLNFSLFEVLSFYILRHVWMKYYYVWDVLQNNRGWMGGGDK